ncbi:hypothetical protein ABEB36_006000 [Hypothenemus hampei]|uniref:GILT-like protein 1 n=1 Tax=Hypothenemus hampei TaxID=57062 RepID=A0ABD1F057_HYPHA
MLRLLIGVCTLALCGGQQLQQDYQKINVSIYFESLCGDSRNFIINQLDPHWDDIKDYVNIHFVPFGKSMSLEQGTKFACQHGSKECKGNRILSCLLKNIPDQDLQVQYVRCFMDVYKYATIDDKEIGQRCAEILNINILEIMQTCYQTKQGTQLQLEAEAETNIIKPTFVPTIVYNGVFDQQLQDASIENFRSTVCQVIQLELNRNCTYRIVI